MFGKLYYKTVACQSTVQATHNFKQLLQTSYPPEKQKVNYITSYLEKNTFKPLKQATFLCSFNYYV